MIQPHEKTLAWGRVALLLSVMGVVLIAAAAVGVRWLNDEPTASREAVCAGVGTWVVVMAGLLPVYRFWDRGAGAVVNAVLMGTLARLVGCGMLGLVGVKGMGMSLPVVLLTMAWVYIPLLVVEAAVIGRGLWRMDVVPGRMTRGVGEGCEEVLG
jgi:hypothetical protein